MSKVAVVGGGAAGMMAAVAAAENGHSVVILEKNEKLGKKLFITGRGRCNVTNACSAEEFFPKVLHSPKFLYSSLYSFTSADLMDFLEKNGCPLKVERGRRVFPVSDRSSDVIRTFERLLRRLGVRIRLFCPVQEICARDGAVTGVLVKDGEREAADAVILATGGLSYPSTGSTGDGYRFAKTLGHTVTPLSPALVPLRTREGETSELMGLSLRNVGVRILDGEKTIYKDFGEMLFTHFGVSGPVLLSASSHVAAALRRGPLTLSIDLKPALDEKELDRRLLRDFSQVQAKQLKNSLDRLLPQRLIPVVIRAGGVGAEKKCGTLTRAERERLVSILKDLRFTLTGLSGYQEAIITQGGICVREVNPSTMESKKVRGLYFAGEVLDVDAVTGGYNLQIAWSTGHLAGSAVP